MKTNRLVVGILAHVDAGKTTLSESMLFASGSIRKMGRVDNKDAFLDTHALERDRGITIFSKQAELTLGEKRITLLDTPGHIDFSAEMERTLQVLDYAILVISGADGVQGHTQTLWRLLKQYGIPVFLFVNKMDQNGTDQAVLMRDIKSSLDDSCIDFSESDTAAFNENIAMCEEDLLEQFLEKGIVEHDAIQMLIRHRRIFPCFFGSALKSQGIQEFLEAFQRYTCEQFYEEQFGARVFKIARDPQGTRLTYLKVTGGSLKVKTTLQIAGKEGNLEEKVDQIRIYSGEKYEVIAEAEAGTVCAVTGLTTTYPGEGLGIESGEMLPLLEPVLNYQIQLPDGCDVAFILPKLKQLEEEEPQLHIIWNESLHELQAQIMGEVQIEILKSLIMERTGFEVAFVNGNILYKETIEDVVEGVGHFEPLRHYAEVHLLLEPGEPGSGLTFGIDCSEDVLDRNWQRLVLTHLEEREHPGVLTGSAITDIKITLIGGRAHQKHTEGGDFRQATYRALRQGLRQAKSVLLEPFYDFRLEIPEHAVGRAMTDLEKMGADFQAPESQGEMVVLCGSVPVVTIRDYQKEVIAYTKGYGRLSCVVRGYEPCHNAESIMEQISYDAEQDVANPTGSVFCAHGAGFLVPWDQVKDYMHVEGILQQQTVQGDATTSKRGGSISDSIGTDEIDAILERTFHANKRDKSIPKVGGWTKQKAVIQEPVVRTYKPQEPQKEYLVVDGYNVIFAWDDLRELAAINIDGARGRLLDILCNYQGIRRCELIVVFDAYRVKGHTTETLDYHNIHVVYTKEAETADQYIERFAHENGRTYHVTVATSDGLEQIIIRGQGCYLLSAREFQQEVKRVEEQIRELINDQKVR
jgi:small GTP-binding protein